MCYFCSSDDVLYHHHLKLTALVYTAASKAKNWASTTALPLPHEHTSRYYPEYVSRVRHALMLWFRSSAAMSILFKQWFDSCRVGTEVEYKHQIKGLPLQLHFSWWPYLPNTSGAACSLEYIGFAVPCEYHTFSNLSTVMNSQYYWFLWQCTLKVNMILFDTSMLVIPFSSGHICTKKCWIGCLDDILCFCDSKQTWWLRLGMS